MEVHGNSMHPEIEEEGDLVIGAPVDAEDPKKENIPYIVVTKLDGVTVKYLQDVPDSEEIILVWANKDYVKPYKVAKENISKLFEVRKLLGMLIHWIFKLRITCGINLLTSWIQQNSSEQFAIVNEMNSDRSSNLFY